MHKMRRGGHSRLCLLPAGRPVDRLPAWAVSSAPPSEPPQSPRPAVPRTYQGLSDG